MRLNTPVEWPAYPFRISHQSPVMLMGSCFSENIGKKLYQHLFPTCINPFGVSYNPLSVLRGLEVLMRKERYGMKDLNKRGDTWFSFDHFTGFSSNSAEGCLNKINTRLLEARSFLNNTAYLILTWGTSWVYYHLEQKRIVNNCHKLPSQQFKRDRLTPEQIRTAYEAFLPRLFSSLPDLRILISLSPVRHLKDGAHENQLSKAGLLLAAEELVKQDPERISYLPVYESVLDDMRDYRFYTSDLVHPNETAIALIWEQFQQALFSEETRETNRQLKPLLNLWAHRPMSDNPSGLLQHEKKKAEKKEALIGRFPNLAWQNLI